MAMYRPTFGTERFVIVCILAVNHTTLNYGELHFLGWLLGFHVLQRVQHKIQLTGISTSAMNFHITLSVTMQPQRFESIIYRLYNAISHFHISLFNDPQNV